MLTCKDITVPNVLTMMRILMAVAAIFLLRHDQYQALAAWMLIIASMLDYFDGWYARKFKQVTKLGAHLDPFADKVLMSVIFISLSIVFSWSWFYFFVSVILLREIAITVYRIIVRKRFGDYMPASKLGKIKTILQSIAGDLMLFYIFIFPGKVPERNWIIFTVMAVIMFITVDSGLRYILPECRDGKKRSILERIFQLVFRASAGRA